MPKDTKETGTLRERFVNVLNSWRQIVPRDTDYPPMPKTQKEWEYYWTNFQELLWQQSFAEREAKRLRQKLAALEGKDVA